MSGKIRPVAPVLSGAKKEHLDASLAALAEGGKHVGFREGGGIDALVQLDVAHGADAVAVPRGPLEIERFGRLRHFLRQQRLHGAALAGEEQLGFAYQFHVGLSVDSRCAGGAAPLDLMQQARACARFENRVGTRAQQEGTLQGVERAVDGAGAGKRSEIDALGALGAAMFQQLREFMILPQQDVGKGFVVTKRNVVTGFQALDQAGFEQQRFGFRRCRDEQHLRRIGDHP